MKNKFYFKLIFFYILAAASLKAQDTDNHQEKMDNMFDKPKIEIKTIGILLYDGYTTLDAIGPYQMFSELMGTQVFFVGRHLGIIESMSGMKVQADTSINEVGHLDILLIPGGFKETYMLTKDTTLINWIKEIDKNSVFTTSVCTGAWILGAAGVLKDKEATTHWYGKKILSEEFGAIVQNERYVKSGKYWTSAGVTAGMDMSLAIINEIMGEKYTKAAMLDLEYDPQPPFEGGSVEKTDANLVKEMREMYDGGMKEIQNPSSDINTTKYENNYDPICKMSVKDNASYILEYDGKHYGFCSKSCMEKFNEDPKKYLSDIR